MPFSFDFGGFDPSAFGGFSGGDASQPQRPKRERKPRKAIGNAFTRTLINLGVTLLFGLGYFYFELPALNFHAEEFYVFVFLLCAVYVGVHNQPELFPGWLAAFAQVGMWLFYLPGQVLLVLSGRKKEDIS